MNSNLSKTNIEIIDNDIWNLMKYKKNEYGFNTVSEYLFMVLKDNFDENLKRKILLKNLEKYYEYAHFDMRVLSQKLQLSAETIIKMIDNEVDRHIPLYGSEILEGGDKSRQLIHKLMIENDILPRELSIAYKLRKIMDINHIKAKKNADIHIDNKYLLSILFPDEEERKLELYNYTIDVASQLIENQFLEKFDCTSCTEFCMFKNPEFIYFNSGINLEKDDLEEDLISHMLKKKYQANYQIYYGICLTIAIQLLMEYNLRNVKKFIDFDITIFKKSKEVDDLIDNIIHNLKTKVEADLSRHIENSQEIFLSLSNLPLKSKILSKI